MLDSLQKASGITEAWGILVDTGAATSVAPQSFASDIELSPAPDTLQLTTATGRAMQTYSLRKVHLQSRGLSLEVSLCTRSATGTFHMYDRVMGVASVCSQESVRFGEEDDSEFKEVEEMT